MEEKVADKKSFMEGLKKHKKLIIILGIVLVLVILGTIGILKLRAAAQTALEALTASDTAVVEKRDLVKSVAATGKVDSIQSKSLSSTLSGVDVMNITVEVGDTVNEGETLALLDTEDARKRLANAEQVLANAQLSGYIASVDGYRNVNDALRGYVYYSYVTTDDNISAAQSSVDSAQQTLNRAQDDYNRFMNNIPVQRGIATEYVAYNELTDDEKKAVDSQKIQYERAIADAQTALDKAKDAYDTTQIGNLNGLYGQESAVLSAESQRVQGELSRNTFEQEMAVENYQKQLDEGIIVAPFSGTVTAVSYEEGDAYAAGTSIITIQDVSGYEVKTEIGEYDIPDIKEGQEVIIKTKTTGDLEMTGHVKSVSPVATKQTVVTATGTTTAPAANATYEVVISIDDPSDRLRLDMNTNMSIIIDKHEGVLTVPYTAVKTDEEGQAYVMAVDENGEQTRIDVKVVMESNYYTEISGEGIEEGMTVAIIKDEVSDGNEMDFYMGF